MAKFAALPLFTDAWLADTHHLSRCQRGLYMDLLVLMWRSPGCRVPNDDQWLGHKLRMSPAEVEMELRPLISEFCSGDGNFITQKRLSTEYRYVSKKRELNSVSAKSRWHNKKDVCERNAPSPSPSPTYKEKSEGRFVHIGEGKKDPQPAVELSDDAKAAIAAHQARERELADREAAPAKTERGREAAKAWLERRGIPLGMQPLNKFDSLRPPATNGHAVADALMPSIADWPAPSAELLSACGM